MFSRFPAKVFEKEQYLAVMHIRVIVCQGLWEESSELIKQYEAKFLEWPAGDPFRNITLGGIYYYWGIVRTLMSTVDDCYDFDKYFAKQDECLSAVPANPGPLANHPVGPWISLAGSSRKGAPEDFIEATKNVVKHVSHCFNGAMTGFDDLAQGELKFYQDDIRSAEIFINIALRNAQDHKQYEVVHRALLYIIRIAVYQGNYSKAEQALKDMEAQLDKNDYTNRYVTFDIARAWYYCILGLPDMVPDWLKDDFEQYGHACFLKNFANQAKARYCYMVQNYPILLTYIHRLKRRESILYGKVEMLAMEACIHYKVKNKAEAYAVLHEAYENALPNKIMMPFIELGKDMRTLTSSALKETSNSIPKPWLEEVNRKAASYAKRQAHVIAEYKQSNNPDNKISLSTREREILTDLSHGLSRTEIAASHNLSEKKKKMVINFVYTKLGAENLADLIHIATEKKMI
jgi:LuxR family maltose regulon positive regulatory protein